MIVINSGDTTIKQNSAARIFWSQLLKKIGLLRWLGLDKSLWFSLKQMDGREKKDTYFKHHFSSHGKHLRKHGFQTMWDSFLERWVFIRSLSVGYFLREKIREIRPQKNLRSWGVASLPTLHLVPTALHLEEMLNLVTTSLTICHSTRDEPICLFGDVE